MCNHAGSCGASETIRRCPYYKGCNRKKTSICTKNYMECPEYEKLEEEEMEWYIETEGEVDG